jgi:hypothetical protein
VTAGGYEQRWYDAAGGCTQFVAAGAVVHRVRELNFEADARAVTAGNIFVGT